MPQILICLYLFISLPLVVDLAALAVPASLLALAASQCAPNVRAPPHVGNFSSELGSLGSFGSVGRLGLAAALAGVDVAYARGRAAALDARRGVPPQAARYEAFQLDERGETQRLLAALGLGGAAPDSVPPCVSGSHGLDGRRAWR